MRRATEKGLADLFDSFGTKSDVAIDDVPESAQPVATLKTGKFFNLVDTIKILKSKTEECVESAICPSNALIKFVARTQRQTKNAEKTYRAILRESVPFHPIPFFGNVATARIITIGLNPSSGEFEPWRCWPEKLDAHELTSRLVGYFRHAHPRPHPWFAELQEAMSIINCPYTLVAAHVDASPWPTLSPRTLKLRTNEKLLNLYNKMLKAETPRLPNFLKRCKSLKLVIIIGKADWTDFIKQAVEEKFRWRVEIVEKNELPKWVSKNKEGIQRLLGWSFNIH